MEYCDYEPCPIHSYGSSSTIFELISEPVTDKETPKDLDVENLMDSCDQPCSSMEELSVREREGEEVEEEEREEEGGGKVARDLSEAGTTRSSLESTQSPRQSVSSGSQHEYIASDSIIFYSSPLNVTGSSSDGGGGGTGTNVCRGHTTHPEAPPHRETATEIENEHSENVATVGEGVVGRGSGSTTAAEVKGSVGVVGDLATGFRNLLSDLADMSEPVGDSGIDLDNHNIM